MGLGFQNLEVYLMKRFRVLLLTMLFMLVVALPAMAQGTQSNSPVQRTSINGATFYGGEGSTETYANLATDYENQDQYILYLQKYNYITNELSNGQVKIPKSDVVFNTNKGSVMVSEIVALNKVEWVYDEETGSYNPIEEYVGDESINLTWSFNPRDYSYHKSVERNIEIGFNEYLQLGSSTFKEYNHVTVSGNIGDMEIVDFDDTGAYVFTGTSFAVIK
jgi:hypothetical protein